MERMSLDSTNIPRINLIYSKTNNFFHNCLPTLNIQIRTRNLDKIKTGKCILIFYHQGLKLLTTHIIIFCKHNLFLKTNIFLTKTDFYYYGEKNEKCNMLISYRKFFSCTEEAPVAKNKEVWSNSKSDLNQYKDFFKFYARD